MFDLHVHTTGSDGDLDPIQIIEKAEQVGLEYIAITDHDTVSSLGQCIEEGKKRNITVIPGVELSIEYKGGIMHILGYGIDPKNELLISTLKQTRSAVLGRNEKILQILEREGVPVTLEEVKACSDGPNIRRPHIALAMVNRGYVKDVDEAFDRYLASEEIINIQRYKLSAKEAIDLVKQAGGITVLAHPNSLKLNEEQLIKKLEELKSYGISGIEAYHYSHSESETKLYKELAERFNLICTCGSDYHGISVKPEVELGKGKNNNIPTDNNEIVLKLIEKLNSMKEMLYY